MIVVVTIDAPQHGHNAYPNDGVFTAHKTINVIWIAQIVFN